MKHIENWFVEAMSTVGWLFLARLKCDSSTSCFMTFYNCFDPAHFLSLFLQLLIDFVNLPISFRYLSKMFATDSFHLQLGTLIVSNFCISLCSIQIVSFVLHGQHSKFLNYLNVFVRDTGTPTEDSLSSLCMRMQNDLRTFHKSKGLILRSGASNESCPFNQPHGRPVPQAFV